MTKRMLVPALFLALALQGLAAGVPAAAADRATDSGPLGIASRTGAAAAGLSQRLARTIVQKGEASVRNGTYLSNAGITAALSGKTFQGRGYYGTRVYTVRYTANTYKISDVTDTARWKVSNGRFCYKWPDMSDFTCKIRIVSLREGLAFVDSRGRNYSSAKVPK